jgi:hypothetical protein
MYSARGSVQCKTVLYPTYAEGEGAQGDVLTKPANPQRYIHRAAADRETGNLGDRKR